MTTHNYLAIEAATPKTVARWRSVSGPRTAVYVKCGKVYLFLHGARPANGDGFEDALDWLLKNGKVFSRPRKKFLSPPAL